MDVVPVAADILRHCAAERAGERRLSPRKAGCFSLIGPRDTFKFRPIVEFRLIACPQARWAVVRKFAPLESQTPLHLVRVGSQIDLVDFLIAASRGENQTDGCKPNRRRDRVFPCHGPPSKSSKPAARDFERSIGPLRRDATGATVIPET